MLPADVSLRDVAESDIRIFFDQQADPVANAMAAFPARDRDAFFTHWTRIGLDPSNILRTIVVNGEVAGNIVSFEQGGQRQVGYWLGRAYWGQGVATHALAQFLTQLRARPLYAHVAAHNRASLRVLEKCGFTLCGEEDDDPDEHGVAVHALILVLDATAASE